MKKVDTSMNAKVESHGLVSRKKEKHWQKGVADGGQATAGGERKLSGLGKRRYS
jgi:hypothetical protein